MHLAFLLPHTNISGGIRVSLTYARELQALGHTVSIMVLERNWKRRLLSRVLRRRIAWFPELPKEVSLSFLSESAMENAICRFTGDALIADSWYMAGILSRAETTVKKFHLVQHDERLYHGDSDVVTEVYRQPLHKIVVATWLKELFLREFNQESALIINSFDRDIFTPRIERDIHHTTCRILILDHSYAWKGTVEALTIVRTLKAKYPYITIVGFGARNTGNKDAFDEYHYGKTGKELARVYAESDIYLCASWDEGFGLPSVEAMACGTALVTYDNGGSRDFAFDARTAYVALYRNETDLASKLERAVMNPEERMKIRAQGTAFVMGLPTWAEQAKKFAQTLEDA